MYDTTYYISKGPSPPTFQIDSSGCARSTLTYIRRVLPYTTLIY